ncbi:CaiB/BaiF CoA transferase family protein [Aestuariirhabdus litorea]|uniref:CaiB/BaiF CoA transferase family protein n=1 Tax=Aestuariirhabdus litorea TaxID=2528527 RepID=UPI0013E2C250|nr:CoA transferase [Aestuariirhabdus litorea]
MKPFAGVKVIDLSTVIAAASAARILADQGAEVIKVESLGGDLHRVQGPILGVPATHDENPVFDLENANKKFIALDLKRPEGQRIIRTLLKDANVLITNYREDALKRLGLTYEDLSSEFPGLVYGHINAYGEKGKEAQKPGYDIIAYFGRTGMGLDTGTSESYPLVNLGGMGDHPTGIALAQGVSAALYRQLKSGQGDKVSVSLYHTGIWTSATMQAAVQVGHRYPQPYKQPVLLPVMGHPYKTLDGEWVIFMLFDFDRYWKPLCESLDRQDLIEDSRFNSRVSNKQNQSAMVEILAPLIASRPLKDWAEKWHQADIPFEHLRHMDDVAHDEQALVNDFLRPITYPSGNTFYLPTPPIQFRKEGKPDYTPSAAVGAHTREQLIKHGYTEEEVVALENSKVIHSAE